MLAEGGLDVGGLGKGVDEAHLAVEERAGPREVLDHLLSADFAVPVDGGTRTPHGLAQLGFRLLPGNRRMALTDSCPVLRTC